VRKLLLRSWSLVLISPPIESLWHCNCHCNCQCLASPWPISTGSEVPHLAHLGGPIFTYVAVFCSGGRSFHDARATHNDMCGPCPCIFSSPRCLAMYFPHSWCFVAMSCTPVIYVKGHLSGMAALQDQKYTGAMVWVNGAESAIFGFLSPNAGAPDADGTA
jgi:hypothetical protein